MTTVLDEMFIPDDIHMAIVDLQLAVMSVSEQAIAGASIPDLIAIAKNIEEGSVNSDLYHLKGLVNQRLREMTKGPSRAYESLKGLASYL